MAKYECASKSDEWYTPRYIMDALNCIFDVDVASPVDRSHCHVQARNFITEGSLEKIWSGFVWCTPPYGKKNILGFWLDKMNSHGNGIALTADRSSAPWWQKAANECDALLMVNGKIKFIKPDGTTGDSPSNGTTLFAYGKEAVNTLERASKDLGFFVSKSVFQ